MSRTRTTKTEAAPITPSVLTRQQAADYMNVSLNSIAAFMHRAENPIPFFRVGARKILFPLDALNDWMHEEVERAKAAM